SPPLYPLPLHDALPISTITPTLTPTPSPTFTMTPTRTPRSLIFQTNTPRAATPTATLEHDVCLSLLPSRLTVGEQGRVTPGLPKDRKSTRLNSSHVKIS